MAESLDMFDICPCGDLIVGFISQHNYEFHELKSVVYVCPQSACEFVRESELAVHLQVFESSPHLEASAYRTPMIMSFTRLKKCSTCSFQCVRKDKMKGHVATSRSNSK